MGFGDEIMVSGHVRHAMQSDPRRVEVLDSVGMRRWHVLWEQNPRIVRPHESGDFQRITNGSRARPYIIGKSDQKWTWNLDYRPFKGELYFFDDE